MNLVPAFVEALASRFGSGIRLVDYLNDPQAARLLVNAWVRDRTAGRIPELLKPDDVTRDPPVARQRGLPQGALAAAIRPEDTKPGAFTLADGRRVSAPMMYLRSETGGIPYLPYAEARLARRRAGLPRRFAGMMSSSGRSPAFESKLTPELFDRSPGCSTLKAP